MRIREASEDDRAGWDDYVTRQPLVPALNRYRWRNILEAAYGVHTNFFIAAADDGAVRGVLPTYTIKDLSGNLRVHSLKFGLVADGPQVTDELLAHLSAFAKENDVTSTLIHGGYTKRDGKFPQDVLTNLVLHLAEDEETQWSSLRSSPRKRIRKAIRSGVVAERGFDNLDEFYDIYCRVMLAKRSPVHSLRYFREIAGQLGSEAELITARLDKSIIGGFLILFSNDIAICPFEFSLPQFYTYAPNQFLIWEAMRDCRQKNISVLDMGESVEGSSVYTFKTRFGCEPTDVYYYSTDSDIATSDEERDSLDGRALIGKTVAYAAGKLSSRSPVWLWKRVSPRLKTRGRIL